MAMVLALLKGTDLDPATEEAWALTEGPLDHLTDHRTAMVMDPMDGTRRTKSTVINSKALTNSA